MLIDAFVLTTLITLECRQRPSHLSSDTQSLLLYLGILYLAMVDNLSRHIVLRTKLVFSDGQPVFSSWSQLDGVHLREWRLIKWGNARPRRYKTAEYACTNYLLRTE